MSILRGGIGLTWPNELDFSADGLRRDAFPDERVGELLLNRDTHDVSVAGHRIELTAKEFAILELLAQHPGVVLTKGAILDHLYGGKGAPDARIIDVFIAKLRRRLAVAGVPDRIERVTGKGYRFRAGLDDVEGSRLRRLSPQLMKLNS